MGVKKTVQRLVIAFIILVTYFMIFVPLAPQFISFVESFVQQNSDMFKIQVPLTKFMYNSTTGNVTKVTEYVTIDFTLLFVFLINFIVYVAIPILIPFLMIKAR